MQITSKQKISSTGFLYSILEFSRQANVAHDESCLCMPGRIVHLRHYETFQLWELWNLFKESLLKCLRQCLLSNDEIMGYSFCFPYSGVEGNFQNTFLGPEK